MKVTHTRRYLSAMLFAALALTTNAQAEIKLEPAQRKNLGIEVAALQTVQVAKTYAASAQVLDATSLITLLSDLRAAQSAAKAAQNEFERAQQLHADDNNVALKVVEAAHAQAINDSGHVDALRAQLLAAWGSALAMMSDKNRTQLVDALLAGKSVLARAETRADSSQEGDLNFRHAQVHLLARTQHWNAQVLGPTTQVTAQNAVAGVGRAYLLRINSAALQPGQVLMVDLADAQQLISGIKVPRSAIIRWQGGDWVFVETADNTFARRSIHALEWLSDGFLVQNELQVDERVVTVGAGVLLAAESTSSAAAE